MHFNAGYLLKVCRAILHYCGPSFGRSSELLLPTEIRAQSLSLSGAQRPPHIGSPLLPLEALPMCRWMAEGTVMGDPNGDNPQSLQHVCRLLGLLVDPDLAASPARSVSAGLNGALRSPPARQCRVVSPEGQRL